MSLSPQNLQTPEEMLERWAEVQCQCDPDVGFLCECCHDTQVVRELIKERDRLREKVPRGVWIEFAGDGKRVVDILHEPKDAIMPDYYVWCEESK